SLGLGMVQGLRISVHGDEFDAFHPCFNHPVDSGATSPTDAHYFNAGKCFDSWRNLWHNAVSLPLNYAKSIPEQSFEFNEQLAGKWAEWWKKAEYKNCFFSVFFKAPEHALDQTHSTRSTAGLGRPRHQQHIEQHQANGRGI